MKVTQWRRVIKCSLQKLENIERDCLQLASGHVNFKCCQVHSLTINDKGNKNINEYQFKSRELLWYTYMYLHIRTSYTHHSCFNVLCLHMTSCLICVTCMKIYFVRERVRFNWPHVVCECAHSTSQIIYQNKLIINS